ncbi:MAG: UDP-N-acetylmuramate--L-alanine ligase [Tissierellia bacterium]|nr:UDP-N-acetylmuramate--L-alanine ligase [Tissierellia bacterium]
MKDLFSEDINKIHLIGIGGSSMVAVAEILLDRGYSITGSDMARNSNVKKLESLGVPFTLGHFAQSVEDANLIIYTSAVHDENAEIIEAKKRGIPLMKRSKFFHELTKNYTHSVAISGAHGKSTVTAMVSVMMANSPLDPTLVVGAGVHELDGNVRLGKGNLIVNEACEFEASFLDFHRTISVILNIDDDHLDYYGSFENIQNAFVDFANGTEEGGFVLMNADDPQSMEILPRINKKVLTFGVDNDADYRALNYHYDHLGYLSFDIYHKKELLGSVELSVPGVHNIQNALAATAIAHYYHGDVKQELETLHKFKGAIRRFDPHGRLNGALLYDDFAHHPKEIARTLEAARSVFPDKRIVVGFQPHTYSRTKILFKDFVKCFKDADLVWIMDIFAAREANDPTIHTTMLVDALEQPPAVYVPTFEELRDKMRSELREGDVFFSVGCGDVYRIFDEFLFVDEKEASEC